MYRRFRNLHPPLYPHSLHVRLSRSRFRSLTFSSTRWMNSRTHSPRLVALVPSIDSSVVALGSPDSVSSISTVNRRFCSLIWFLLGVCDICAPLCGARMWSQQVWRRELNGCLATAHNRGTEKSSVTLPKRMSTVNRSHISPKRPPRGPGRTFGELSCWRPTCSLDFPCPQKLYVRLYVPLTFSGLGHGLALTLWRPP